MSLARWFHSGRPAAWVGGRLELTSTQAFSQGEFLLLGQGCTFPVPPNGHPVDLSLSPLTPVAGAQVRIQMPIQDGVPVKMIVDSQPQSPAPEVGSTPQLQRDWFRFLKNVDEIFSELGLLRVSTPSLVVCPGVEPVLEPIAVNYKGRFLPTSPELHLKKLLANDYTDFFEMRPCFRVETPSPHHEPEFTMLEWYRGFATSEILIHDLQALLSGLSRKGWGPSAAAPSLQIRIRSMAQLFQDHVQMDLKPSTPITDLWSALKSFNLHFENTWSWDDCFHLLFLEKIESQLGINGPELVCNYPPSQAALAKLAPDGWADRMELYWHGLEIANGFGELTDAAVQRARFAQEMQIRKDRGMTEVPLDPKFIQALEAGVPQSAGMALGLERLFMAFSGIKTIQDIKLFPESNNADSV